MVVCIRVQLSACVPVYMYTAEQTKVLVLYRSVSTVVVITHYTTIKQSFNYIGTTVIPLPWMNRGSTMVPQPWLFGGLTEPCYHRRFYRGSLTTKETTLITPKPRCAHAVNRDPMLNVSQPETSHYSEGSLVRRVRVRVGLGLGLGVKGYVYYIIFYYTLKTNTRQVRTSEPSD